MNVTILRHVMLLNYSHVIMRWCYARRIICYLIMLIIASSLTSGNELINYNFWIFLQYIVTFCISVHPSIDPWVNRSIPSIMLFPRYSWEKITRSLAILTSDTQCFHSNVISAVSFFVLLYSGYLLPETYQDNVRSTVN